jgi:long-chain fatty acid transport protein
MKILMRLFLLSLLLFPTLARAGGFELIEQSPAGVGTAGAQSAVVDDAGANYYNPARMTYIRGFTGFAAIHVVTSKSEVTPPPGRGAGAESSGVKVIPMIMGVWRLGSRFAFGLGGFSNMAQSFDWRTGDGQNFEGRYLGTKLALTTLTVNPNVAFRPVPWISFGVGIDIVPASFELRQTLSFGAADGDVHATGTATGVGGNVGLYIRAVKRWLDLAFTYRSAIDLDFKGHAALRVPAELSALAASFQDAQANITLPHNFTFGIGSHLLPNFRVSFDAHLTLWDSLKSLTLTLTDPAAPPGTPPTVQGQQLNFRISYGLRLGLEYRMLNEQLRVRLGGGYERTPVPRESVRPLSPDGDRGLFSVGLGYHFSWGGIDLGYMLVYIPPRQSAEPEYRATYQTMAHLVNIGLSLHFEEFTGRINEPDFKR